MPKAPDNKKYAREFTIRFLQEMDRILGSRDGKIEKVTATEFSEVVGTSSSNLTRLRTSSINCATIDMGCKMCEKYGTSPSWLFMGRNTDQGKANGSTGLRLQLIEEALRLDEKSLTSLVKKVSSSKPPTLSQKRKPANTSK